MVSDTGLMRSVSLRMDGSMHHGEDEGDEDAGHSTCSTAEMQTTENQQIGGEESKQVFFSRFMVFAVLVGVAAATTTLVFRDSKDAEEKSFVDSFEDTANKVTFEFIGGAKRRVTAVQGFADQISSHVHASSDVEWPNVVLPDFEHRARTAMRLSDVLCIIFLPIVTNETRASYEEFTVNNIDWMREGLAVQGMPEEKWLFNNFEVPPTLIVSGESDLVDELGSGPYAPWWQFAPAVPYAPILNYDTLTHHTRQASLNALLDFKKTVVSESVDLSTSADQRKDVLNAFLYHTGNEANYEAGPVADLYVPIFENLNSTVIAGSVTSYIYWQSYFEDLLPANDIGVYVLLENNCNQTFTYRIDGGKASYIGLGRQYDSQFESMGVSTDFGSFLGFQGDKNDLPDGQCLYRVTVYPSEMVEDKYVTSDPLRFTLILVGAFIFTSLVFVIYDYHVERRQKVVLTTAVKSSNVVASLFPQEVRDRFYDANEKPSKGAAPSLASGMEGPIDGEDVTGSDPIADLYSNCTVQFCDIVGFTSWSSQRSPKDVFKLLETLYKAFDKVAFRLGVFKVETIGDCYVAVTGLPVPQEDHAEIMAKFASECLVIIGKVTTKLADSLGQDTIDLSIRIGLHSGPVTAGVLRGAKARFQLFGDTVNTAARMESTGSRAKIHLSMATAELLRSSDYSEFVFDREDEVVAKGKGKLKTCWLKPLEDELSTTRVSTNPPSDA